ncbi:hypothetical protein CRG98_005240 [Punica granatum]|nr:hypothetical protein CRG98_005240 [Punica granatum]
MYTKILKLCATREASNYGLLVHGRIVTNGLASNLNLHTPLILFYSKLMNMEMAHKVFDVMRERNNVVSWTAIISGYCQKGCYENAILMFRDMHRAGVRANQFTYGSTLRACTGLRGLIAGMQVQAGIEKGRFVDNLFVQSALIDFHSKCGGEMAGARRIFEIMSRRDLVTWNTLIGGYAIQGFSEDSLHLFQLMMREGMCPDCFTLGNVLRACAGGGCLMQIMQMHSLIIRTGFVSYVDLIGSIIDAYAKCGAVHTAHRIYKHMERKDVISCTALITAYARKGNYCSDVLDLFEELNQMQVGMDPVMLCSMLHVCANLAFLSLGRQIHSLVLKYQSDCDVTLGNALVDMYAKCGEIGNANRAFNEMRMKNIVSWTSLIAGYARHGFGHAAIELYKKMEHEGVEPNDITFLCLLFACSHTGLTSEGWECFGSMIAKYKITPRVEHLSCMVDLCARCGKLEEALGLIHDLGIKPNPSLLGAILGASRNYGSIPLGETAAMKLIDMDPENSAHYIVLASLYAQAGAWENVWATWKMMEERGLKKGPGYSLLQYEMQEIKHLQPE